METKGSEARFEASQADSRDQKNEQHVETVKRVLEDWIAGLNADQLHDFEKDASYRGWKKDIRIKAPRGQDVDRMRAGAGFDVRIDQVNPVSGNIYAYVGKTEFIVSGETAERILNGTWESYLSNE